jgi:membrane protein DedA with SNARE-associated domain
MLTQMARSMPLLAGGLEDRIVEIVDAFGYVGIGGLIALETVFPPIPSEVILPLAGFLAGQGHLTLVGVIIAATLGSVIGSLILYGLGHWYGHQRLRGLIRRYGHFVLLKETDLDRAHGWFDRHAGKAVLIGRLVPGVRSLISLPAGVTRMPLHEFVLFTAVGSSVWNGLLVGLGWGLGNRWEQVQGYTRYLEYAVILAVLSVIALFAWSRRNTWREWRGVVREE